MPRMTDAITRLLPWRTEATTGISRKASKAHRLVALESLGQPQWAPRDYAAFAREGFMQNAIVYRCVRMVSEAAASIPLLLYEGAVEIDSHALLDLMAHPSLDHTSSDFFESWYGYLLVSGNAYVEAVGLDGTLRELHVLRPDRMKVIPGADGWPEAHEYTAGGRSIRLTGDVVEGVRSVLHVRLFHPTNDYYGMSPIEAAASAIDIHNQAAKWNKALLDNSARPSGALVYAARDGNLTEEQFQRLKEELEVGFQGARAAGRPMLLEGGLDWKQLSLSPKDMDFVEAKNAAAREIALALGVPPMLLGIPGDNTYSNYQEASRSFWRQTVLPLVVRTAKAMSAWLGPAWGGGMELRPDLDAIEALSSERDQLWARLEKASFLSRDEKRAAAGYGPIPERESGDGLAAKYNPDQPRVRAGHSDGGRWTSGGGGGVGPSEDVSNAGGSPGALLAQIEPEGPKAVHNVDLMEDENLGGHTIARHVARPEDELLSIVRRDIYRGPTLTIARKQQGSFLSIEDANNFTNRVLEENPIGVADVVLGKSENAEFFKRFGYETGREAFRPNVDAEPYIRSTLAVVVRIQRDARSRKGFRVFTSYPTNQSGE